MSTLRISNIEAKADSSSPTVDEQLKFTNSDGDLMLYLDGRTAGITTVGINTTNQTIKFDANNNVMVTGIITATEFHGTLAVGTSVTYGDNEKAYFGTGLDMSIYHNGSNTIIKNDTGELELRSNVLKILGNTGAEASVFNRTGSVDLMHNGTKKFETTSSGVTVTGTAVATGADINGDLDVDGHTNLDNVSIAGVTTITGSGNALEIVGGLVRSRNTASARFVANNGSAEGYFGWSSGVLTVGQAAATLSLEATGSNHIQLKTNGTERLRIHSNGRTVIGGNASGTQPSATVAGAQFYGGSYPGDFRISSGAGASGTTTASIAIMGSNHNASIENGANSGAHLNLYNYNTTDGNSSGVMFLNSNGLSASRILGLNVSHSSRTGALVFMTSNGSHPTEKVRINSSGAVMINTNNSSSRTLNLKGTFGILSSSQTGVLDMSVTDGGEASIAPYVAGGSTLILKTNTSGSGVAERLRITSRGYREIRNYHYGPYAFINNTYKSTITVGDPGDGKHTTIKFILTLEDVGYRQGFWQGEFVIWSSNANGGPGVSHIYKKIWDNTGSTNWNGGTVLYQMSGGAFQFKANNDNSDAAGNAYIHILDVIGDIDGSTVATISS